MQKLKKHVREYVIIFISACVIVACILYCNNKMVKGRKDNMNPSGEITEEKKSESGMVAQSDKINDTVKGGSEMNTTDRNDENDGSNEKSENGGTENKEIGLNFDVRTKTTEEISSAVPKIFFENKDYTTYPGDRYPYYIMVNTAENCVTVYGRDSHGTYSVPVRAMTCSTAREGKITPTGTFTISDKYTWRLMVDGTHSQYAVRFNGQILFHAVPCYSPNKDDVETAEFNKLGNDASLGCVRLCVADAKWIYENCPAGTVVRVYEDEMTPGPLGKPVMVKIPEDSPYASWDPTDPDEANPWNSVHPVISIKDEISVKSGDTLTEADLMQGVTAVDTMGNDISAYVGIINIHQMGDQPMWQIMYYVSDSLGKGNFAYRMIRITG